MQIQQSNNQPNFGIRIKNPKKFSNELLDAVINSPMTKEIDKKYPNSSLEYWYNSGLYCSKPHHVLTLRLNAKKIKGDLIDKYNKTFISADTYEGLSERLKEQPQEVIDLLKERNAIIEANNKTSSSKYNEDRKNLLAKTTNSFWGNLKNAIFGTEFLKSKLLIKE